MKSPPARRRPALKPELPVCGASFDGTEYLDAVRARIRPPAADLSPRDYARAAQRYFGDSGRADSFVGLADLVAEFCTDEAPNCSSCPLRFNCSFASERVKETVSGYTFADLFCGAGGLSLGFEQTGLIPRVAIDSEGWSVETYLRNRPGIERTASIICGDIRDWVQGGWLPEQLDIVAGGIPCQPFSMANRQRQDTDPREDLFAYFFNAVDAIRPRVILIENVSGFRKIGPEVALEFERHGYAEMSLLLDAQNFGLPQGRRRVFLVAFSHDHFRDAGTRAKAVVQDLLSQPWQLAPTLRDAIGDLPGLEPVRVSNQPEYESDATGRALIFHSIVDASDYVRRLNNGRSYVPVFNHKARYNNDRDIEIFSTLKPGEDSTSPSIADIMPYKGRGHIFKDKYYRLRFGEPCRTITAHMRFDCNMYIHPVQPRGLTAREAARVQGFPDDYVFVGTFQRTYQQVGNAVPPPLARVIGETLIKNF